MKISIPSQWRDVSQIRQVPDHQEVYQDCTFSNADGVRVCHGDGDMVGTGACIIVEILQREEGVSDGNASMHFFKELAEANGGMTDSSDERYNRVWMVGHEEGGRESEVNDGGDGDGRSGSSVGGNNLIPRLSTRTKACTCIGHQSIEPLKKQKELEDGKASRVRIELCALRLEKVETDLLITLMMPC